MRTKVQRKASWFNSLAPCDRFSSVFYSNPLRHTREFKRFFFAPEIQSEAEQHEVSGYIRRALGLLLLGLHMHDLRYERSGRQKIAACTVRNTEMLYSGHEFIF
jgi:hypothetical protein